MGGTRNHRVKWSKLDWEGQISDVLSHMHNLGWKKGKERHRYKMRELPGSDKQQEGGGQKGKAKGVNMTEVLHTRVWKQNRPFKIIKSGEDKKE
jgi:hypothetical protein